MGQQKNLGYRFWYLLFWAEKSCVLRSPQSWSLRRCLVLPRRLSPKIPDPSPCVMENVESALLLFKHVTSQSLPQEKRQRKIIFLKMPGRIREKNAASPGWHAVINCSRGVSGTLLTNASSPLGLFCEMERGHCDRDGIGVRHSCCPQRDYSEIIRGCNSALWHVVDCKCHKGETMTSNSCERENAWKVLQAPSNLQGPDSILFCIQLPTHLPSFCLSVLVFLA